MLHTYPPPQLLFIYDNHHMQSYLCKRDFKFATRMTGS